ncbi:hypothetical protein MKX68_21575 [Paenibacillus sp. FSL M8-0212]|uniref:hypothetical protein n=1 Tax=Paenibacillus sp. FSL M8-0212 TaxID=2921618 RepID=UPI0030F9A191
MYRMVMITLVAMLLLILGGCAGVNEKKIKDQEIINRSEAIAIEYLKDTYNLDVTITDKEIMPKMAMSWVTVYGHVKEHKEQTFSVSINYETNKQESFIYSQQLKSALQEEGYILNKNATQ